MRVGVAQHFLEFIDRRPRPLLAQFEQAANIIVGPVREDLRDRALSHRGHATAARIDRSQETRDLPGRRDRAVGQFLQGEIRRDPFVYRQRHCSGGERAIEPNPAPVDDCVQDLNAALGFAQAFELG
jgi:hypothetical protein